MKRVDERGWPVVAVRGVRFGGAAIVGLALAGCAAANSRGAATSASPAVTSPITTATSGSAVPDWPALQAAVAAADDRLATATSQGWWSGPVCNPDIEQHREQAGQDPLSDGQLRAECAANLAQFAASKDAYDRLQALDPDARAAEFDRVAAVLGRPVGQEPTIGQVVVVQGCEQGWITDPADCAGIPAG